MVPKMAYQTGAAYHADSDADDEYERSVMTSPTQLHTDSENSPTDSDPLSNEHTPTTFGNSGEDQNLPRSIITEWTADECAQFVATLGLRQYCDAFIGECGQVFRRRQAAMANLLFRKWNCWRSISGAETRRIERDGNRQRWTPADDTEECVRNQDQSRYTPRI